MKNKVYEYNTFIFVLIFMIHMISLNSSEIRADSPSGTTVPAAAPKTARPAQTIPISVSTPVKGKTANDAQNVESLARQFVTLLLEGNMKKLDNFDLFSDAIKARFQSDYKMSQGRFFQLVSQELKRQSGKCQKMTRVEHITNTGGYYSLVTCYLAFDEFRFGIALTFTDQQKIIAIHFVPAMPEIVVAPDRDESKPLEIHPDKSLLVEPLLPNNKGIDYFTAIRDLVDPGIEPEQNALRDLVKAFGRNIWENSSDEDWENFCKLLHLDPKTPVEIEMKTFYAFAAEQLEKEAGIAPRYYDKEHRLRRYDDTIAETVNSLQTAARKGDSKTLRLPLIKTWLESQQKTFDRLTVSLQQPIYFIPHLLPSQSKHLYEILFPTRQTHREWAKMFEIKIRYEMEHHLSSDAWEDTLTLIRLGHTFNRYSDFATSQLFGFDIAQTGYKLAIEQLKKNEFGRDEYLFRLIRLTNITKDSPWQRIWRIGHAQCDLYAMLSYLQYISHINSDEFSQRTKKLFNSIPPERLSLIDQNSEYRLGTAMQRERIVMENTRMCLDEALQETSAISLFLNQLKYVNIDWNVTAAKIHELWQAQAKCFEPSYYTLQERYYELFERRIQEKLLELPPKIDQWIQVSSDIRSEWTAIYFNGLLFPDLRPLFEGACRTAQYEELVRTMILLEVHRIDFGKYPSFLYEVNLDVPIKNFAMDYYSGQLMIYAPETSKGVREQLPRQSRRRRTPIIPVQGVLGCGYVLYSRGIDGNDNHGKSDDEIDYQKSDIRIRMPEDFYDQSPDPIIKTRSIPTPF